MSFHERPPEKISWLDVFPFRLIQASPENEVRKGSRWVQMPLTKHPEADVWYPPTGPSAPM